MSYVIGQPYKRVVGMRNGSPVYEMTEIVSVFPDKLVLANGTVIDRCAPEPPTLRDPIPKREPARLREPRRLREPVR